MDHFHGGTAKDYLTLRMALQGDTTPGGLGWVDFDLGCSKAGGPLL